MSQLRVRRTFLRDCLIAAGGAGVGVFSPQLLRWQFGNTAVADEKPIAGGHEERLKALGIELPAPAKPVAVYVPAVLTGNLLFTAGHIPWTADGKPLAGRLGQDLTVEQGAAIARQIGLSILTTVRQSIGSLDRVARLVKATGMVNCTSEFYQQPQVINGFSELMIQVFGESAGKAARSAVGMNSLPANVPVEIEAIFEVHPSTP